MMSSRHFWGVFLGALLIACGGGVDTEPGADQLVRGETVVMETGTLQAVHYAIVAMPWYHWEYGQPTISDLRKEGDLVRAGDVVGQIETGGVLKVLDKKEPELAIEEAELVRLKTEQATELTKLEAERLSSEVGLKQATIDTQRVTFDSPTRREIERLKLAKARIALNKIERKRVLTSRIQEENRKIQQAKIAQVRSDLETARRTVDRFTLRAPSDGMIEYRNHRRSREKIKIGDKVFWGTPILGVPDLTQMKALTAVNETDAKKVHSGQAVIVRLDAYPKIVFKGSVTKVSKVFHKKSSNSRIKVFDVEILLDGTHRLLKPGMTVSCEFLAGA